MEKDPRRVKNYIKTENSVYRVCWEDDDKSCAGRDGRTVDQIFYEDIVAQSDNLADLVEEWVFVKKGELPNQYTAKYWKLENLLPMAKSLGAKIVGAIWTPWGLKYAVCVNESDDLEFYSEVNAKLGK